MKRIGYTITAGGETKTTILDKLYPDEYADAAVIKANKIESGPNIKGLYNASKTIWSTFDAIQIPSEPGRPLE